MVDFRAIRNKASGILKNFTALILDVFFVVEDLLLDLISVYGSVLDGRHREASWTSSLRSGSRWEVPRVEAPRYGGASSLADRIQKRCPALVLDFWALRNNKADGIPKRWLTLVLVLAQVAPRR